MKIFGILFLIVGIICCSPSEMGKFGELFNSYQLEYIKVSSVTTKFIDVTIPVRIRLYGNDDQKQKDWQNLAKENNAVRPKVQWAMVSTTPPQIFGDLRERNDELVINTLSLGHEIQHVLKLVDVRVVDPDEHVTIKN